MTAPIGRRHRLRRAAGSTAARVAALAVAAAVVAAAPAVASLPSDFIAEGRPGEGEAAYGDHLQTSYRFWLLGHQLERGGAPWLDPYSFQPLVDPQVTPGGWPFGVPYWPLEAAAGPVLAWNLLLLAVTAAALVFTYLWLRELALPPAAAALGGLAFALAPYRLVQSGGHLLGWSAVLVPLALWALERSRRAGGSPSAHAWGALAAAAVVSIPLSGQLHLALGALPLVGAYALVRRSRAATLWAWGGVLAAAGAGLALEELVVAGSTESGGRTLAEVAYYSASPADLLSRRRLGNLERYAYLGWLTPALALLGVAVLARRRRSLALLLGLTALVPALLALGTNLPGYEALRDVLPPLRYPRVPGRLLPLANLALAALAAAAAAALLQRARPGRRTALAAALLALVAADLLVFPLRATDADEGNAAYAALAAAEPGRILELPVFERGTGHVGSVYLYYALQAPRERPTGYALAPQEAFGFTERFNRLDCGAWLPGDREELERLGIRFVLFHAGLYRQSGTPGAWFAWEGLRREGLGVAAGGPAVFLWEEGGSAGPPPVLEPDRSRPVLCDGWTAGALEAREGALWLHGSGTAELVLAAEGETPVTVLVDGREAAALTVAGTRTVPVELGDDGWHALVVRGARGLRVEPAVVR
ncbi:MAG TPA: hypothetical protein VD704_02895 [Gaiellaceae bacterium]|nr:hypothetical protein [Gaiellaceae bacterium]